MSERNYNPSLTAQNTKQGKAYLASIRKMEPEELLLYWITERHKIHCDRYGLSVAKSFGKPGWEDKSPAPTGGNVNAPWNPIPTAGGQKYYTSPKEVMPPPWSEDPIFQNVYFCNVYRECDKVTGYLRDNFRQAYAEETCVFLGTILLRMFNYIPTMKLLIKSKVPQRLDSTKPKQCYKALEDMLGLLVPLRDAGEQMFGGAYIINFHMEGIRKVEAAAKSLGMLIEDKELYFQLIGDHPSTKKTAKGRKPSNKVDGYLDENGHPPGSMAYAADRLQQFPGFGNFYVYQYIGDLAYTHCLRDADDWNLWSFCGPGTSRGLWRLRGETDPKKLQRIAKQPPDWYEQADALRTRLNKQLKKLGYPQLHMRDLTNCLCEFDKYSRALGNERSIKRPYNGV